MRRIKRAAVLAAALLLPATATHRHISRVGSLKLSFGKGPYFSASRIPLGIDGAQGPAIFSAAGGGTITGGVFIAPPVDAPERTGIIAATQGALAYSEIAIVPPPPPQTPVIAVAAYDDGIALHDRSNFHLYGYAAIGGAPVGVAVAAEGSILSADTDGDTLTRIRRDPWQISATAGVPLGNEVAVDRKTGDVFVTDRDVNGMGALTRIAPDGKVSRTITGQTAEGLAVDESRGLVYAGNVNDGTVAEVDTRTMTVVKKIRALPRVFGIALDAGRRRLYVVSNVDADMRMGAGHAALIDLSKPGDPIVARSAGMPFPIGVVRDPARHRVFVTDESADRVYVLNDATLAPLRAPLATCRTPWIPAIAHERLYVPCARANAVDVFDLRTLRRVRGAPFATGGFPVSVAVWP